MDNPKKRKLQTNILMNMDAEILNKILANQVHSNCVQESVGYIYFALVKKILQEKIFLK